MEHETHGASPNVRQELLPLFTFCAVALLLLAGIVLFIQYIRYYEREINANHQYTVKLYQQSIRDCHAALGVALRLMANDDRAKTMLAERDTKGLTFLYEEVFQQLKSRHGLNHLIFIASNCRVVARLHKPSDTGDMVPRPLYAAALQNGNVVSSIDAGRDGRLILRMVAPVFMDSARSSAGEAAEKRVISGFVQVGMDISGMVKNAGSTNSIDLAFVLDRDRLTIENLHRLRGEYPSPFWVETGHDAEVYTTMAAMDRTLAEKLYTQLDNEQESTAGASSRFSLIHNALYYVASAISLTDSEGQPLGALVVIENSTRLMLEYGFIALLLLVAGTVVILMGRKFIGAGLERTDKLLEAMHARIVKAEQTFESVFNQSETAFVLLSQAQGEVIKANARALALFCVADAKDISLGCLQEVPANSEPGKAWAALGAPEQLKELHSPAGTVYCVTETFFIDSNIDLQCLSIRNVTGSIRAKMETQRHTEHLQRIIDELPTALCLKDQDLRVTMHNATFARIFGNGTDLTGTTRHPALPENTMDRVLEADRQALASGSALNIEVDIPRIEGNPRTLLVSKRVIRGQHDEPCLLVVCTDIAALKQSERELVRLNEQAQTAIAAKSEFLACMSHEMRTPLNVILGMAQLAASACSSPALTRQLEKIHEAATGLLETISQILDFANAESGKTQLKCEMFSLNTLLDEAVAKAQALPLRPGVCFERCTDLFDVPFVGDALRLGQALDNLLSNAAKFTHEGKMRLVCKRLKENERCCHVYFAVEDSGIGIPEERMDRLFNGFGQLEGGHSRRYGGVGMGLAVTRHFIHLMNGEIGLNSTEGKGSTFFFTVPLEKFTAEQKPDKTAGPGHPLAHKTADAPGANPAKKDGTAAQAFAPALVRHNEEAPPHAIHSGQRRVLVVEDNPVNQEILQEILESFCLPCDVAGNGEEALSKLGQGSYDIILMDIQMPVMDGLAATRAIRALDDEDRKHIPIIALTANALPKDRQDCEEAGMNGFLSKPVDIELLKQTLDQWLGDKGQAVV